MSVDLARAITAATSRVLLKFLKVLHRSLLLLEKAKLVIPLDRGPGKSVCPVLVLALLDKALASRLRALLLLWFVPVLKPVAVIDSFVEPFKAFDLFILTLQDLILIVKLSESLVFDESKLLL